MKPSRLAFLAILGLAAGCARVNTTTTLRSDGSFTRKIVYTVTKNTMGTQGGSDSQQKSKPEDFFKLPVAGPGVSVTRGDSPTGLTVTVTREIAAGADRLDDLTLLDDAGKPLATSSVAVRKLADGKIEYVETLHTLKPGKDVDQMVAPDLRARVKKILPAELQKTDVIDETTKAVMVNIAHALVGPPDPLLFSMLTSTDAALRKLNAAVYAANVKTFKETLAGITEEQARMMARGLANAFNQDILNPSSPASPGGPGGSDTNAMTPLFFSVSFPGRVVETDGIEDPVQGDVYWSLLPAALDLGDVKLRLVVQP